MQIHYCSLLNKCRICGFTVHLWNIFTAFIWIQLSNLRLEKVYGLWNVKCVGTVLWATCRKGAIRRVGGFVCQIQSVCIAVHFSFFLCVCSWTKPPICHRVGGLPHIDNTHQHFCSCGRSKGFAEPQSSCSLSSSPRPW